MDGVGLVGIKGDGDDVGFGVVDVSFVEINDWIGATYGIA